MARCTSGTVRELALLDGVTHSARSPVCLIKHHAGCWGVRVLVTERAVCVAVVVVRAAGLVLRNQLESRVRPCVGCAQRPARLVLVETNSDLDNSSLASATWPGSFGPDQEEALDSVQAHPHTSCHPLRHENLPATRSSSKLPASTHVVLTESRASDQEEESAFDSDRRSGVACSPALTRPHLLLSDSQVRSVLTLCDITYSRLTSSASSQLFDRRMLSLSLSDSRGLRLPWFIPSVLPSTCPHLLQSNEPTHVLVAPCSSSPSPGRCGFIRSSLPSPGQCGLHTLVALLVTAISGSVRPLLLLLLVAASR